MFEPPFCPHQSCPRHRAPHVRFYQRHGHYQPLCRARPVQRFRCKTCRSTFSTQTFRADFRDHKPELNAPVVELLCSGIGLRQCARLVRLSRRCLELKARKLSRCVRQLDRNLRRRYPVTRARPVLSVHFDEFETFEERRNTRPVTIATAIESNTRFIIGAHAGPIRPSGKMTEGRRRAVEEDERRFGPRKTRSWVVCRAALRRAADMAGKEAAILLSTDEKTSYPTVARRVFGDRRLVHRRTPSVLPRGKRNPLFPINHEEACLRDKNGRLRRESWLVSKRRHFLNLQLCLYAGYRNYVRPRFNEDSEAPAQMLRITPRRLGTFELVGWRQVWGERSVCPIAERVRSWYRRRSVGLAV
jgi:transposase-like protein